MLEESSGRLAKDPLLLSLGFNWTKWSKVLLYETLGDYRMNTGWSTMGLKSDASSIGHINLWLKLAGKSNAGNPHAAFVEAGADNKAMAKTVNPAANRKSLFGNPRPKVYAPVFDPTDEGTLEMGYGRDIVTLPKETGRNREHKLRPVATTPVALLYSE